MCARKRERERKRERKRERRSYFIIMLHELFNKFNGLIVREDLYFLYKHNISRIALGKLSEQKKKQEGENWLKVLTRPQSIPLRCTFLLYAVVSRWREKYDINVR